MKKKKETPEQRAQRLEQAREAAAKAMFDQYERWNDRGFLTAEGKPILCSTHDAEDCKICHKGKRRRATN